MLLNAWSEPRLRARQTNMFCSMKISLVCVAAAEKKEEELNEPKPEGDGDDSREGSKEEVASELAGGMTPESV